MLDVDGTLVDSNYRHTLCWYRAFREHGSVLPVLTSASSAQRAGVETIAVITGGFSRQELDDAGAVAVFESLVELRERIGETPLR